MPSPREAGLRRRILHLGEDIVRRYYTGWGFSGHWDGHACWHNPIAFPFWLVSALQWLTDTRDPIPSGHGYVHSVALYRDMYKPPEQQPADAVTWDHMREIARRVYGNPDSFDPYSGYKAKAYPAFFHTKHSVMKDCLPVDDFVFPLLVSRRTRGPLLPHWRHSRAVGRISPVQGRHRHGLGGGGVGACGGAHLHPRARHHGAPLGSRP